MRTVPNNVGQLVPDVTGQAQAQLTKVMPLGRGVLTRRQAAPVVAHLPRQTRRPVVVKPSAHVSCSAGGRSTGSLPRRHEQPVPKVIVPPTRTSSGTQATPSDEPAAQANQPLNP